jgi:hypothetical protein
LNVDNLTQTPACQFQIYFVSLMKIITTMQKFLLVMVIFWSFYFGTKLEMILHSEAVSTWDWVSLGINLFMVWFFSKELNSYLNTEKTNG